ncbi:MAG: hypothetical protein AAGA05_00710 [Pseudomonadota bacterium]
MNQLKLRALVSEATSSRLQIAAANIEASIVRADALGFAMDEMAGLQDLIDRERARDTTIAQIQIVTPVGTPLLTTGSQAMPEDERAQVMRRVLGSGDRMTRLDIGDRLYTGRLLYDSSDAVMGAVVITTPTEVYLSQANAAFQRMTQANMLIFGMIAVLLLPFIVVQFSGARHAYLALDPQSVDDPDPARAQTADTKALQSVIAQGNAVYAETEAELDALMRDDTQGLEKSA